MGHHELVVFHALIRQCLEAFIEKTFQTLAPGEPYIPNWHIELIADYLTRCYRGMITRLIITVPPRSLKSICASVAFPAWVLGNNPDRRIICASYSNELSVKHARDCKSVIESDWYQDIFPRTRLARSAELDLVTTHKGGRYATSLGGSLTGRGGSFLIVDDPLKPSDALSDTRRNAANQWFDNTLYSRLDNKSKDVIIVVMQRVHPDDLIAHIQEKGEWVQVNLPAIAEVPQVFTFSDGRQIHRKPGDILHPEREPESVLDEIRATMGEFHFTTQYQQRPIPVAGNLVRREWLQFYEGPPTWDQADRIVLSWDTAGSDSDLADYSVCTIWKIWDKDYYLLDVFRERLDFPALRKAAHKIACKYRPRNILIEDMGTGKSLLQELKSDRGEMIPYPTAIKPRDDKIIRMSSASYLLESGHVYFPKEAEWLAELITELLAFPYGKHDDQVDSVSQFLNWIDPNNRNTIRMVRLTGL